MHSAGGFFHRWRVFGKFVNALCVANPARRKEIPLTIFYNALFFRRNEGLAVSMDLFRRKQKIIYWIVALIIIPSFVLVWGVDRFGSSQSGIDVNIGTVNGKPINYAEFEAFQKRILGALGGLPLNFAGLPDAGSQSEEVSKFLFAHAMLEDAKKAGLTASDLQVGTYLQNSHPVISPAFNKNDPQSLDKAADDFCRSMSLTRADLIQGIRDWQTIGNYVDTDGRLANVNDETVYAFYSLNKAEVVVKRLRIVENDALRAMAKDEIMAKPEEDLQREARNYAAGKAGDVRYRTPAKWRFAWLLVPFVPAATVPRPSDAEIQKAYEAGKAALYENKPLEEVRDRVVAALVEDEVERQTIRNFSVDVDPQLRGQKDLPIEELVKLTQLAKYGVTAGDTGPEALPSREVVMHFPDGTNLEFAAALEAVDTSPIEMRDSIINDLKTAFNLADRPYRGENGLYRIRLLDYQPSTPAPLDGPDGKMNPDLFETALADMVGEHASQMAREQAEATEAQIREYMIAKENGQPAPDADFAAEFDAMPTETVSYLQIADSNYTMGTLPIGDVLGPRPYLEPSGERGQELIVMVDRRVPSRESYAAEPDDVKDRYRAIALYNYRGGYGVTYTMTGPAAFINPGPSLWGGLMDKFYKGEIRVNPELMRRNEG